MTTAPLTDALSESAALLDYEALPGDIVERSRQSLLDWFAVTLGGSQEDAPSMLLLELVPAGGDNGFSATAVGHRHRLSGLDAALVNGTSSHRLDFDDVNVAFLGHPSAPVLAAALAVAEQRDLAVADLVTAYTAGYETACRIAVAVGPEPYLRGFHATGTIGTLGAAAACARLLELDKNQTAVALGIAASQAAGLKCNIGTMTKSLHAGRASQNGMLAALLAARGFTASTTVIEADQGFAAIAGAHADASAALAGPESGWHLRDNLFKYHASCFFTHSMIEGLCDLRRDESVGPSEIEQVTVHVSELQLGTCVIAEPRTGLEVKFSMAHLAAMTLLGRSTSRITDADANDAEVIALRGRVVLTHDATPGDPTHVELALRDGRRLDARHDVNKPADDLDTQGRRLAEKFTRLAEPVLGVDRAEALLRALTVLDASSSVRELMALSRG